jgi:ribonuclease I
MPPILNKFSCCLQQHEWQSHGICAGAKNAADFFTQVCSLASAPLAIMTTSRNNGGSLSSMATALTNAGYEVFATDTSNSQVELSACAGPSKIWVLAPVSSFSKYCGGW